MKKMVDTNFNSVKGIAHRALTGIDYVHKDNGESRRVEKGEKIEGLNEIAVRNELKAGNIELWEEKVGEK